MEKLGEEALARLDVLAAKMGVGAEHMWEVLTKQGKVEAFYGVLYCLLCLVGGVGVWGLICLAETSHDAYGAAAGLLSIGILVVFVLALEQTRFFFNPEMYALEYVRGLLQ
jgi:hypothetical protein